MSYEGYDQYLCMNGHLVEHDVHDRAVDDTFCPICSAEFVWFNAVNETNGSFCDCPAGKSLGSSNEDFSPKQDCEYCDRGRIDGYVLLEIKEEAVCEVCNLGHKHIISARTYKIPTTESEK